MVAILLVLEKIKKEIFERKPKSFFLKDGVLFYVDKNNSQPRRRVHCV